MNIPQAAQYLIRQAVQTATNLNRQRQDDPKKSARPLEVKDASQKENTTARVMRPVASSAYQVTISRAALQKVNQQPSDTLGAAA
ncbi:MAG: hypothetical protein HQL56_14385 [Magnetococcales bacterium]|nr:hypothetical protein [Magnetococcales bacterium]